MLIVIAILATLATLLLPAVNNAKRLAGIVKCQHNLHSVGVALQMYLNESEGIMPVAAQMPSLALNDEPAIADVMAPWLESPKILQCPADVTIDYFQREGSSYEYHSMLGGTAVGKDPLSERWGDAETPAMNDYASFHRLGRRKGAMNFLFVNGQVSGLD
ncbi:MAG: hypothetical protein ACYTFO_00185 [Planctomycetota bacterium]|jgi:type II secretory pathway pseudopilin PulG